jgi:hypothetical protein
MVELFDYQFPALLLELFGLRLDAGCDLPGPGIKRYRRIIDFMGAEITQFKAFLPNLGSRLHTRLRRYQQHCDSASQPAKQQASKKAYCIVSIVPLFGNLFSNHDLFSFCLKVFLIRWISTGTTL